MPRRVTEHAGDYIVGEAAGGNQLAGGNSSIKVIFVHRRAFHGDGIGKPAVQQPRIWRVEAKQLRRQDLGAGRAEEMLALILQRPFCKQLGNQTVLPAGLDLERRIVNIDSANSAVFDIV